MDDKSFLAFDQFKGSSESFEGVADRLPYGGQTSPGRKGQAGGIKACAGPLATSVRDLQLFTRLVIQADPWRLDSSVIFSTWRTVAPAPSKLRLGFILEDTAFPVHPPLQNTLNHAVAVLKAGGHEIVPLATSSLKESMLLAFRLFAMDPARTAFKHIKASGEPRIPALSSTDLPHPDMPYEYSPLTLDGLYELNVQREKFKEAFRSLIVQWRIDAIMMPGYQGTAPQHDLVGWVPYTIILNLLDYPTTIIPYRKANQVEDAKFLRDVQYIPPYVASEAEGAPCCVQVVGRHMQEEELLRNAEIITSVLYSSNSTELDGETRGKL